MKEEQQPIAESTTHILPRIYVASLADYNAGRLHGRWIDADQDIDDIRAEVAAMLAESPEPVAEEWAIHDYENFAELRLSEFEDLEQVAEAARLIGRYGPVVAGLLNHLGGLDALDEANRYMEEAYRGEYDRPADYAEALLDDCYSDVLKALPDFIRCRIDYEGIADDLQMGGDIFIIEDAGQFHVFDARI